MCVNSDFPGLVLVTISIVTKLGLLLYLLLRLLRIYVAASTLLIITTDRMPYSLGSAMGPLTLIKLL